MQGEITSGQGLIPTRTSIQEFSCDYTRTQIPIMVPNCNSEETKVKIQQKETDAYLDSG